MTRQQGTEDIHPRPEVEDLVSRLSGRHSATRRFAKKIQVFMEIKGISVSTTYSSKIHVLLVKSLTLCCPMRFHSVAT